MFPFSFLLQWLFPDPRLSLQDLRKQVAPLLKSFQGEVSLYIYFVSRATLHNSSLRLLFILLK